MRGVRALKCIWLLIGCLAVTSHAALTSQQKKELLDRHNFHRNALDGVDAEGNGYTGAARNMKAMVWDADMATSAQRFADRCEMGHGAVEDALRWKIRLQKRDRDLGQSIFANAELNVTSVVDVWHSEVGLYSWTSLTCTGRAKDCSHFSQMMHARTQFLGCGAAQCGSNLFLVCDYSPGQVNSNNIFEKVASAECTETNYAPHCELPNLCASTLCEVPQPPCGDTLGQDCFVRALSQGQCDATSNFMQSMMDSCPHTCGYCESSEAPACVDLDDLCGNFYLPRGYCDPSHQSYSAAVHYKKCAQTCGGCAELETAHAVWRTRIADEFGVCGVIGGLASDSNDGVVTGSCACTSVGATPAVAGSCATTAAGAGATAGTSTSAGTANPGVTTGPATGGPGSLTTSSPAIQTSTATPVIGQSGRSDGQKALPIAIGVGSGAAGVLLLSGLAAAGAVVLGCRVRQARRAVSPARKMLTDDAERQASPEEPERQASPEEPERQPSPEEPKKPKLDPAREYNARRPVSYPKRWATHNPKAGMFPYKPDYADLNLY